MKTVAFGEENFTIVGNRHYLVESWEFPDEYHSVDTVERNCSCVGFNCTGSCRHLEAMEDFEREYQRYREATLRLDQTQV